MLVIVTTALTFMVVLLQMLSFLLNTRLLHNIII